MMGDPPFGLELETRVRARPETVFAFFTNPTLYRSWKGQDAELDPRPGGLYRIQMPGHSTVEGTFLVIEPPHRVVFTWGWVGNPEVPPGSTTVEVTFALDGDETVVRLGNPGPDPLAATPVADQSVLRAEEVRR